MSKTNIIIHVMPWELDELKLIVWQLKNCFLYVDQNNWLNDNQFTIDILLNISNELFDWNKSELSKEFVIDEFKSIIEPLTDIKNVSIIGCHDVESLYTGVNDLRRAQTNNFNLRYDYFIYLDTDMFFPENTLYSLVSTANIISEKITKYFILTPQTIKMWDNTWDIITNEKYVNDTPSLEKYINFDPYKIHLIDYNDGECKLLMNGNETKIGGGWLNLISAPLFRDYIDIPEELGGYGLDDTYLAWACDRLKQYNICNYNQFILSGLIVTENRKYKKQIYKKYLTMTDENIIDKQRQNASQMFLKISKKFIKKCVELAGENERSK